MSAESVTLTADPEPRDPLVHARRWKTLGVLALSLVIIGLDNTILNVALPTLQDEFGASGSTLQWMVDSYLLVFAALLLAFGMLGDRFGRKLALQSGVAIFGLSSLGALFVDSASGLIAVRAGMGVGAAMIMPATLSIIANVFPREEQGKAIGAWAGLAAVGIGLGPLTGGLLLEWFSWSSVFMVNVPFAVVALALGFRFVPESRDPSPGRFDVLGTVLSAVSLTALVWAIIEAQERGWTDSVILGGFGVAAVLGALFVIWELHTASPMFDLGFFRSAGYSVGSAATALAMFAMFSAIFVLTQYLQFARGYSALEAGAAATPLAAGLIIGSGSSHRIGARIGVRRLLALGLLGTGALLAVTSLWTPDMPYWPIGLWFFGLAFSMGWILAPGTGVVMSSVPAEKSGAASAMANVSRQVAGALGVAIIGTVVSSAYASGLEDAPGVPADVAHQAGDSIGAANAIGHALPAHQGAGLIDAAGAAFTDAMGRGLLIAAAAAMVGAAVAWQKLPREAGAKAHAESTPVTLAEAV